MKATFAVTKDSYVNANIFMDDEIKSKPYQYHSTKEYNAGAAEELRSDGYYLVPVMDFDLSELKGKKIKSAKLILYWIHNPVEEWDIGTISYPWTEGSGKGLQSKKIDGITYDHTAKGKKWPEGSTFNQFTLGSNNSRHGITVPLEKGGKRQEIKLDLATIYSLIERESYGISLYDTRSDVFTHFKKYTYFSAPKWIHSSQSKIKSKQPVLEIEYDDAPLKVSALSGLKVTKHDGLGLDNRGLKLKWKAKGGGDFSLFTIRLNGKKLPRFQTPLYKKGQTNYEVVLYDLNPDCQYKIELNATVGKEKSKSLFATAQTGAKRKTLKTKKKNAILAGSTKLIQKDNILVYGLDEYHKIDPVSGDRILDSQEYKKNYFNTLVKKGTITLSGAKNEALGFQLLFKSSAPEIFSILPIGDDKPKIKFFKELYVPHKGKWHPDPLLPMENKSFPMPAVEQKIKGQKFQAIYCEILLKTDKPGKLNFTLDVFRNGNALGKIPVEVNVQDFKLEVDGDFQFDMHAYNFPAWDADSSTLPRETPTKDNFVRNQDYFKICHEHRTDMGVAPYNQYGQVNDDAVPVLQGKGANISVADWTAFDKKYSTLLDGSEFKDLHRDGKMNFLYLPFFENWPMEVDKYYKPKVNTKQPYIDMINEHKSKATTISKDMDPEYREGIKRIVKEFILHFEEKGWAHTTCFFTLINKWYYKNRDKCPEGLFGSSWWLIDEPFYYEDWRAIRYFGEIFQEAKKELKGKGQNFHYRACTSWPAEFHHYDGGIMDTHAINFKPVLRSYDWYQKRIYLKNEKLWTYGTVNNVTGEDTDSYGVLMQLYLKGGTGFLPWLGFGKNWSYNEPDICSIAYDGRKHGVNGPIPSLRLKTIRRMMQDIEYISLVSKRYKLDRYGAEKLVESMYKLKGYNSMGNALDAGKLRCDLPITAPAVIRETMRGLITKKK